MKKQEFKHPNYHVYTIKTNKYKTGIIEMVFRDQIDKETMTIKKFLFEMLTYTNHTYPTRQAMIIGAEDLYNINSYSFAYRTGNVYTGIITLDFLDPKYCEKGYLTKAIDYLMATFNLNLKNNAFDKKTFQVVKKRLRDDILSLYDNPTNYGFDKIHNLMGKDEQFNYKIDGYLKELDEITPASLYEFYLSYMAQATCDIYILGNLKMNEVDRLISKKFNCLSQTIKKLKNEVKFYQAPATIKKLSEQKDYQQGLLMMGFFLDPLTESERNVTFFLANIILGAGGLDTKLYTKVREENSLCYNISSIYQRPDNLIYIKVGLDANNAPKAIKLINECLASMQNGDVTEVELAKAKKNLILSIKMAQDNQGGLINDYMYQNYEDFPDYLSRIKMVQEITVADIIAVSKKIHCGATYLLQEGNHEEN